MNYTREERAVIWLSACGGMEYRESLELLRAIEDPVRLFDSPEEVCEAWKGRDPEREAENFLRSLQDGVFCVTFLSDDYPENLQNTHDRPPLVLYGMGNRSLLKKRRFCLVGSRITPSWAEKTGRQVAEELSRHVVVVTGLAEGGDGAAIAGALPSGNLIVVLPCGIHGCYPAAHVSLKAKIARQGLVLSERLPDEKVAKYSFHERNRILAGLCDGVLVLSAGEKSGALITANRALDYGRDVFALPYNLGVAQGVGCNDLIKKGAYLLTETEDILLDLGIQPTKKEKTVYTEEEGRMLAALRERGEAHAAELAAALNLRIFEATAILSSLELKGAAVKSGGNKYTAI